MTTLATAQTPGEIAVGGGRVWWNAMDADEVRSAPVAGGATTAIGAQTGNNAITTDATHVYWTRWSDHSIRRAPLAGGAIVQIYPPVTEPRMAGTWPVEVDAGWVYFAGGGAVYRVPRDGGMAQLIQDGAISGFALTRWGDHAWIYWGDRDLGGLVWRQRLD